MTVAPERISANHWPGLDTVPSGPRVAFSAAIARKLFKAAINRLDVTVVVVGEGTYGKGGPTAVVHRPDEFFARLGRHQLIGFGEAYQTGAWDAEDLGGFLEVLASEMQDLVPKSLQSLRSVVVKRPPRTQKSSKKYSQDNISHHYDLSNDLFQQFLDPTLTYSSALFDGDPLLAGQADLEAAQGRKIERLLDQAGVGAGSRVLEIGSGWGELCIRAARRGATITSVTLSTEQKVLGDERVAAAAREFGFDAGQVSIQLCDYRDVTGEFDAIVSVEMIEAVGWQYWRTYFEKIDEVLAPGGKVAIQAITMPHDRMLATRNTYTWINKYIFPGGFLPSVQVVDQITREHTSLRMAEPFSMGEQYARTLTLWDEAFLASSARVLELGFDDIFLRMWHFYLEYSRAGFASGYIDVNQLTFSREGD